MGKLQVARARELQAGARRNVVPAMPLCHSSTPDLSAGVVSCTEYHNGLSIIPPFIKYFGQRAPASLNLPLHRTSHYVFSYLRPDHIAPFHLQLEN